MAHAHFKKHIFQFKVAGGTSRGVLHNKTSYFLIIEDVGLQMPAIGECSLIQGLSPDPGAEYEATLQGVCDHINGLSEYLPDLDKFPSIRFGYEVLMADFKTGGSKVFFQNAFTAAHIGIPINGLIWMGSIDFMKAQIAEKIAAGFRCLKLKIGANDFESELGILKEIRSNFGDDLVLRVDANGAFGVGDALEKLKRLGEFNIHSIEQPIAVNQWEEMARLCASSPVAIALDEELIGVLSSASKKSMMEAIKPQYIILKPSLIGGWKESDEWIGLADDLGVNWWMTSALEGNPGLNAVTQFTSTKIVTLPQGLGTGSLYTNNLPCPLYIKDDNIWFNPGTNWDLNALT